MVDDYIEPASLLLPLFSFDEIGGKSAFAGSTGFTFVGDGTDAGVMLILSQ